MASWNTSLEPQTTDTIIYEGEGGAYYTWTSSKSPAVEAAKLGGGILVLQSRGFALPHYADSAKIGYVTQGTCTVGFISPNSQEEKILVINKGDAIPVPIGTISWWFNGGTTDTKLVFLGETSLSYTPGQFNYFFLTGALGILGGFSTEFITKIYHIKEIEAEKLTKSQKNLLVLKLDEEIKMPHEPNVNKEKFVFNMEKLILSHHGGVSAQITEKNFPVLGDVGLSAELVRLKPNFVLGPSYTADASYRTVFVTEGSGRVQIVGLNGQQILDSKIEKGQLFVVPKFFSVAHVADGEGMEFFSVVTSSRPIIQQLNGNLSPWKALSSSALQAALNVDSKFVKFFQSKVGGANDIS